MNTQYKYLHFVAYKMLGMWDVKRYGFKGRTFSNAVRLRDVLRPFDKSVSTEMLLKNNWAIISKINFSGDLFLRDVDDAKTFKGKLHIVDGDTLIYSKINVRHGCIYYHANSKLPFAVSSEYPAYKLDTTRIIGSYLVRILQSSYFKKALGVKATGISKARVKPDEFLDIQIPLPSLAEQQALVDAYNHNLQQATELEQKAENGEKEIEDNFAKTLGIIKHNPQTFDGKNRLLFVNYAQISQWGVDFILHGSKEIHSTKYPCKSIETLCKISSGGTPNRGHKDYFGGNIPWIKTGELRNEILTDTEEKITEEGLINSSAKLYPKGSLAIAMYGATIGKTAKFGIDATTNQACAVLTCIKEDIVLTDYLWLYLQTQTENLKAMAYGGAQPNINAGIIATYKIPIPPLDVQAEIVAEVQAQRAKIAERKTTATTLRQEAVAQFEQAIFE